MLNHINEIVLNVIQQYNSEFNKIAIHNNILKFANEEIDLGDFNLESIFESYQLKLDLSNMQAQDLFAIIKLNASIFNSNKEGV